MGRTEAETLALEALGWLAETDDLLQVFLGAAGLSSADVRARAGDPEFLAGVLDFLLMEDDWVRGFVTATGRGAGEPMAARAALPGGDLPHWT